MSIKEQGMILKRGGELLGNGFTLMDVLQFLGKIYPEKMNIFFSMIHELEKGREINEVLSSHHFHEKACITIYFADKHGYLAESFTEAGNTLLRMEEDRKKLSKLLQYPLILLTLLIAVSILLHLFLLPRFELLYHSMGYSPAGFVKFNLHLMQNLPSYLSLLLLCSCIVIISYKWLIKRKTALEVASILSSVPVVKIFYRLHTTIFLSREWSFLLRSGFSMIEIVEIMKMQQFHPLFREVGMELRKYLLQGSSFSYALRHLKFIENEMIEIVVHGEKSGRIDRELHYYSYVCLQKLEDVTSKYMLVIQPVVFCLIGIMVASIYLSIFFPMFEIIDAI